MDLIAKLPTVAAIIYRNLYRDGKVCSLDSNRDWSANFASMLGFDNPQFTELMRCLLYTSPSPRDRQKSRMPSSA